MRALTGSRDAQRAMDTAKLGRVDERRVRDVTDVYLAVLKEAAHILGTEAVAHTS